LQPTSPALQAIPDALEIRACFKAGAPPLAIYFGNQIGPTSLRALDGTD
jgi:hypothetical protein